MAAHIRKRGKSFQVCYRRGGRAFRVEYAGSFPKKKLAETRRDLVAGWLAAGLDPKTELARLASPPPRRTFAEAARAYKQSRVDLSDGSRRQLEQVLKTVTPMLDVVVDDLTPARVQEFVLALAEERSPRTVRNYLQHVAQILDHADVDPNPARHRTVRPPRVEQEEVNPPPAAHVLAILDHVPAASRLPIVVLEQTAMRVGELEQLAWGDVDVTGKFRIRAATTKTSRARWVQLPAWLIERVLETCPFEDRVAQRRVFPRLEQTALRSAMRRACKDAGIPHYHPHDLRHRRLSLWHGQGIPVAEMAKRAGHSRASMTLDVYSHVMPLEEITEESWSAALVMAR